MACLLALPDFLLHKTFFLTFIVSIRNPYCYYNVLLRVFETVMTRTTSKFYRIAGYFTTKFIQCFESLTKMQPNQVI